MAHGRQRSISPGGGGGANTLSNIVVGLSLLMYWPFEIGDSVRLIVPSGVQTGKLEDLTLGYIVIKTQENNEIVVPNSVMASQAIIKSVQCLRSCGAGLGSEWQSEKHAH